MDLKNIRLISHQLLDSNLQTPWDVATWMGAIQSQDYNMAKWAIGIRLQGSTEKIIEDAFNKGQILRTHVMRPTWHFVTPENIRWMLDLTGPRLKSATQSNDRHWELTESIYSKCNQVIEKALDGGKHLLREEIASALNLAGIEVDNMRMYRIMFRAELDKVVCSGALRGKKQTYALLNERVPLMKDMHKDEALVKLTQIYFMSHSPATVMDFSWWSGLSVTDAKKGINELKSELVKEKINGQDYWIMNALTSIKKLPDSIFLLPAFDEFIISYRDRNAIIDTNHQTKAFTKNGIFYPTIIENGKVIGIWKKETGKKNPILNFFEEPDFTDQQLLSQAIKNYQLKYLENI